MRLLLVEDDAELSQSLHQQLKKKALPLTLQTMVLTLNLWAMKNPMMR